MSEQLELFNPVFEGSYVKDQILGKDRGHILLTRPAVERWARKRGLTSFVIKYADDFWVKRVSNSRGEYIRTEHSHEP